MMIQATAGVKHHLKNGEIIEYTSVKKAKKADQTSYIISLSKISGIDKYLNENCAKECKHFILKKKN